MLVLTSRRMRVPKSLARDTTPEAERVQLEIYRRMTAVEKIERMEAANRRALALAEAGVRSRHPRASDGQVRRLLMDLTLGAELAAKVYGSLPAHDDRPEAAPLNPVRRERA